MIVLEQVAEVPEKLLSEMAAEEWTPLAHNVLQMSTDLVYLHDSGVPLLFAGAFRESLLVPQKEVWMFGTGNIRVGHLRTFRTWFRNWCDHQSCTIIARAKTAESAKYLRFFGFVLKDRDRKTGIETYEMPSWTQVQ